jgi:hypothetical protein
MVITLGILTKTLKPVDVVIGLQEIIGQHSGVNIGNPFYEALKLYKLENSV